MGEPRREPSLSCEGGTARSRLWCWWPRPCLGSWRARLETGDRRRCWGRQHASDCSGYSPSHTPLTSLRRTRSPTLTKGLWRVPMAPAPSLRRTLSAVSTATDFPQYRTHRASARILRRKQPTRTTCMTICRRVSIPSTNAKMGSRRRCTPGSTGIGEVNVWSNSGQVGSDTSDDSGSDPVWQLGDPLSFKWKHWKKKGLAENAPTKAIGEVNVWDSQHIYYPSWKSTPKSVVDDLNDSKDGTEQNVLMNYQFPNY